MSFDINGYLGTQVEQIKKDNYDKHKEVFERCEELNRFAHSIKYRFNINSEDNQGIMATVLYIKLHNAFQGTVIMYRYGLESEAKSLVRSALETSFVLKAIVKDENNLELMRKDFDKQRELNFKRILEDKNNVYADIKKKIDIKQYDELKDKNEKDKAKTVHISEWAEIAGSLNDYYYAYKVLCSDVHVDLSNMEKYVVFDKNEKIESFNSLPSTQDIGKTLYTAMFTLLTAIDHMNNMIGLGIEKEIRKFEGILIKLKDSIIE